MSETKLSCVACGASYPLWELRYSCSCEGLLEVTQASSSKLGLPELFEKRLMSRKVWDRSGVWRFREGLFPLSETSYVSMPEGQTGYYEVPGLTRWAGVEHLAFKHEGENPSGSFKDRGMCAAVTAAKKLGVTTLACASTGNTSSSLAAYAARAGLKAFVFLPAGKVSAGKMAQTLAYGAKVLAVKGDFDDAMQIVRSLAQAGRVYMVNSLNPFRIEGQKTIIWELLQDRNWEAPDWILVPGGNLGNTSAFGKAIEEAYQWGWIQKKPRLATIQAMGASPFFRSYERGFQSLEPMQAETVATAIRIGHPVNFTRAVKAIEKTRGVVAAVSDAEIMAAKAAIDRSGLGCEPASAASLAGLKQLVAASIIRPEEDVVAILTGHVLKDTDAIMQSQDLSCYDVDADRASIEAVLDRLS